MDNNHSKRSTESSGSTQIAGEQEKGSERITNATRVFRAVTAIMVFGIPLVAGTATLLTYGFYKAFKRMASRP